MMGSHETAKMAKMHSKPIGGEYKKVSPTADNSLVMIQNKLTQLRKVRYAREAQKQHAVASNEKIREYSTMIESKETEIMKLITVVDMMQDSRKQHIKEAGEAFDKEHPFEDEEKEINMLRDAEEALSRSSMSSSDYLGRMMDKLQYGLDPGNYNASPSIDFTKLMTPQEIQRIKIDHGIK